MNLVVLLHLCFVSQNVKVDGGPVWLSDSPGCTITGRCIQSTKGPGRFHGYFVRAYPLRYNEKAPRNNQSSVLITLDRWLLVSLVLQKFTVNLSLSLSLSLEGDRREAGGLGFRLIC